MTALNLRLNRPQSRAIHKVISGNTVCLPWGRGVGKSFYDRLLWYRAVAEHDGKLRTDALLPFRGVRIVCFMPTLKACKDVHLRALEQEIAPYGIWGALGGILNKSDWIVRFPGGSWIQFFGAERADSARGLRADIVTADECDDIDADVYDGVIKPWFSEPWSLNIRILSGTPRRGRFGLLYRTHRAGSEPNRRPNYYSFHATYKDAPETVSRATVEEARLDSPPDVFSREWECNFDSGSGLVYPAFDERFHVRTPDARVVWSEILVGVDHGHRDPGVFLILGVQGSGRDARVHVLKEIYETGQDEDWWCARAREIVGWYPATRWYCDPSMPSRVNALKKAGARTMETDNSIDDGVSAVANFLAIRTPEATETNPNPERYARLYVDPSCKNLIREFGLYSHHKAAHTEDGYTDAIVDKHNHCLVGSTIVTTYRGEIPIRDVVAGDLVATREGWRSVLWSGRTFESVPTYRLTASDGRTLEGTADHRVWTENRGFVQLDTLRYGDILRTWHPTAKPKSSFSKASVTGVTPIHHAANCANITPRNEATDFTAQYGRSTTALSRPVITCTIATATRATIGSATSNAYQRPITDMPTVDSPQPLSSSLTWRAYDRLPLNGIGATRGALGIESTQKTASRKRAHTLERSATCAELHFGARKDQSSAQTTASQSDDVAPEWTTSHALVLSADSHSNETSMGSRKLAVVSVADVSSHSPGESVYDLTVEGAHEFFANGILVHNSLDAARYGIFNRFGTRSRGIRRDDTGTDDRA